MIGRSIGKYRITRQIGAGGMGAVFEAVHEGIGQRVAVKVLHPAFSTQADIVNRFFNEARAVNIVKHPGLVKAFDFGQLPDGTAYMTMEFLEGETLRARLQRLGGTLGLPEALRLARQVASALLATHDKGIIHRDLKPDNVFIIADPETPSGERAKLLDFGVAKVRDAGLALGDAPTGTVAGAIVGTPQYMSPEQCRGAGGVTDKSDVYSLGVVLYQVLAGQTPFTGQALGEMMVKQMLEAPVPLRQVAPGVPEDVAVLVHRLLAKSPGDRPAMSEVVLELERLGAVSTISDSLALSLQRRLAEPARAVSTLSHAAGSPDTRGGRSRARLWVMVLCALTVAGVGVWAALGPYGLLLTRRMTTLSNNLPNLPNFSDLTRSSPAAPAGQAPPARNRLMACSVTSEPKGATVLLSPGRVDLGLTPWTGELVGGQEGVSLFVRRAGYAEQTVTIRPGEACRAHVKLAHQRDGKSPGGPHPGQKDGNPGSRRGGHGHGTESSVPAPVY